MDSPETEIADREQPRRFATARQGMVLLSLVLGLLLGLAEKQRRLAIEEAAKAKLIHRGLREDGRLTLECFVAMKLAAINRQPIEGQFAPIIDPAWVAAANHYNAGRIADAEVPGVVRELSRIGQVFEVRFTSQTLEGVRLFYLDRVPYDDLASLRHVITIVDHSTNTVEAEESP